MRNEKIKNNLGILFVILTICFVFGIGGFYLGSRFKTDDQNNLTNNDIDDTNVNNKQNDDSVAENNNNKTDNNSKENNNNWMDYIMNSEIGSITMTYCVNATADSMIPTAKTISITKSDLKQIFSEMNKGSIAKNYYGGLGGPCMSCIDIDYTTDKKYELSLILNKFIDPDFVEDSVFLSYFDNIDYTIKVWNENIDLSTEAYMFEYIYDESIIETIITKNTK